MTQTAPRTCTGLDIQMTEDGPEAYACTCSLCRRPDYQPTGFTSAMLAVTADEEW